ncbi:hypothetical protein CapIbe_017302 [Capra ibex]
MTEPLLTPFEVFLHLLSFMSTNVPQRNDVSVGVQPCTVWAPSIHPGLAQEAVPADGPVAPPVWLPRALPLSPLGVQASPGSSEGVKPRSSSQCGQCSETTGESFVLDSGTPVVGPPCLQWMPEARKARTGRKKFMETVKPRDDAD